MKINNDKNAKYSCPIEYTLELIGGKWKVLILWDIYTGNVRRYGEIKRSLKKISHKMLSQQLKALEEDNLINRKQYNVIPPKTEYSLTKKGETLIPLLNEMCKWGNTYIN